VSREAFLVTFVAGRQKLLKEVPQGGETRRRHKYQLFHNQRMIILL